MNILRVYPFLPPLAGGMEKHIMRLTQEQRRQGHQVTVAYSKGNKTSKEDIRLLPNIPLKSIKPQFIRDILFYLNLIFFLVKSQKKYDVIHIHGAWSAFFFGNLIKKICSAKKLIGSIHDGIRCSIFWVKIYKYIFRKYTFIYCTGNKDAKFLTKIVSIPVYWRSSGVDELFYSVDKNVIKDIDIISVGSFVARKNHLLILKIAKELPQFTFSFVGEGPLFSQIKNTVIEENISNVSFYGNLGYSEVAKTLERSKIFLMTSFSEGTPTALLESMASGCTVITSNSNDFSQVFIDKESGFVIDGFQVDYYVNLIASLLSEPANLEDISTAAVKASKNYSWSRVAEDISNRMIKSD